MHRSLFCEPAQISENGTGLCGARAERGAACCFLHWATKLKKLAPFAIVAAHSGGAAAVMQEQPSSGNSWSRLIQMAKSEMHELMLASTFGASWRAQSNKAPSTRCARRIKAWCR